MTIFGDFLNNVLKDLRTDLMDEFDRNFERKAFFDEAWKNTTYPNTKGSTLMRSGALRRGNRAVITSGTIRFFNSLPYASIHNEGGVIVVTERMKKFFWAMYYKTSGAITFNVKTKVRAKTPRNTRMSQESEFWKAMALKKTGSKITIDKRQFIGMHNQVDVCVHRVVDINIKTIESVICKTLKK